MIEKGIASNRLEANGYGEERPIASNNTRNGRRTNRRVEINLIRE
jgi:outer membrane protein OmpA-like peptidoglycan-associated protein